MEFDGHEAFEKSGSDFEEDFVLLPAKRGSEGSGIVALINPASDWDDAVWKLSLQSN